MKKLLTLVFVCIAFIGFAQKGNFIVSVTSNGYELKLTQVPKVPNLVYFDTREIEWRVTCLATGQMEKTITPLNGVLNYHFNGNILIHCRVIYRKNGTFVGQQSLIPKCIFGLNPSDCFKKL